MVSVLDPTKRFAAKFSDKSKWIVVEGVPCFTEHDEKDDRKLITDENDKKVENPEYGQVVRSFGEDELQEICDNCNRRYQHTGDACPLTLGHTRPGEPEEDQPKICGYALSFRLGRFGGDDKLAILADFYVFPDMEDEFNQHPRRSVELFPRDNVFDPIALLRRTPELDMGLVSSYSKRSQPYLKDLDNLIEAARYQQSQWQRGLEVLRFSVEEANMVAPQVSELAAEEKANAARFMRHYRCHDPVLKHAKSCYGKDITDFDETDPGLSLREQDKAERFLAHYMKHAKVLRQARKMYEAGEAGHGRYSPEDAELTSEEEKQADAYWKQYSAEDPLMQAMMQGGKKYAAEDDDEPGLEGGGVATAPPPDMIEGDDDGDGEVDELIDDDDAEPVEDPVDYPPEAEADVDVDIDEIAGDETPELPLGDEDLPMESGVADAITPEMPEEGMSVDDASAVPPVEGEPALVGEGGEDSAATAGGGADPGFDEEGDLPEDHQYTAQRYLKHLIRTDPVFRDMYTGAKRRYEAGMAGPASVAVPGMGEEDERELEQGAGTPVPYHKRDEATIMTATNVPAKTPSQAQKDKAAIQKRQGQASIDARLKKLEDENRVLRYQRNEEECRRYCTQLLAEGIDLDPDDEIPELMKLNSADRKARIEKMRKRYQKAPIGEVIDFGSEVDQDAPAPTERRRDVARNTDAVVRFSREDRELAVQYQLEHPEMKYADVVAHIAGEKSKKNGKHLNGKGA